MRVAEVSATHQTGSRCYLWHTSLPRRCSTRPIAQQEALHAAQRPAELSRRNMLGSMAGATLLVAGSEAWPAAASSVAVPAAAKDFVQTASGLRVQDVRSVQYCSRCAKLQSPADIDCCVVLCRAGSGATPQQGDRVSIHWSGYTAGVATQTRSAQNLLMSICHCRLLLWLQWFAEHATSQGTSFRHQSSH